MIPLIEQHRDALADLCRRFRVERLETFGSAATGGYVEGRSDLDFLVTFTTFDRSVFPDPFDPYFGLKEQLESLLGRKVDLVCADAIRNPVFLKEVNRSRRPVYAP